MSGPADGAVISVVVADDHEVVRAGFAALLDTQPDFTVLGTASDGAEAVAVCLSLRPDVVLMDIRMPGTDGIEATQRLTAGEDPPRVLILTTFDLDEYVFDALRAGASGFLLKDVTAERLFEAVRVIAAGEALLAPTVTRRLISEFARLRPQTVAGIPGAAVRPGALAALTPRETEVLRLVAEGLSNTEIAGRLVVTEETVKTHVSRILSKLGLRDRTQAVVVAYESGLVIPGRLADVSSSRRPPEDHITCGSRGAVEDPVPGNGLVIGPWLAVSVETLHPAERKHAICMRNFHGMRSFHVVAACGTVVPRKPGIRAARDRGR